MTAVHLLLPTASPHDAITGQTFARRDLIREWGDESEIVAAEALHELASSVLGHGRGPA